MDVFIAVVFKRAICGFTESGVFCFFSSPPNTLISRFHNSGKICSRCCLWAKHGRVYGWNHTRISKKETFPSYWRVRCHWVDLMWQLNVHMSFITLLGWFIDSLSPCTMNNSVITANVHLECFLNGKNLENVDLREMISRKIIIRHL